MELLKFSDSPKSSGRRKNPAGFIGAGIMVAVMGLSSTLAGTIAIGTNNRVEFGQGVVTTAACDTAITLTPASTFVPSNTPGADTFTVTSISLSGIGGSTAGVDNSGCLGKVFEIRAFAGTQELSITKGGVNYVAVTVTVPSKESGAANEANYKAQLYAYASGSTSVLDTVSPTTVSITATAEEGDSTAGYVADAASATAGARFTISGFTISPSVTKITVESRSPRSGATDEAASAATS